MSLITYEIPLRETQLHLLASLTKDAQYSPQGKRWRATDPMRRLYGIVGFTERWMLRLGPIDTFYNFYVPQINQDAVAVAMDTKRFSKPFDGKDKPLLEFIYRRHCELRKDRKYGFPRFTVKEVAKKTNISREKTKEGLDRLVGILAPVLKQKTKGFQQYWILPASREELAEKLIQEEIQMSNGRRSKIFVEK